MPDFFLAWLLTYGVHSTLLLGSAWLLTRLWRRLPAQWVETLWRTALLGGVLTASVQMVFDLAPAAGTVALPGRRAAKVEAPLAALPERPVPPMTALGALENTVGPQPEPVVLPSAAAPASTAPVRLTTAFGTGLAGLWLVGLLVLLIRQTRAARRLRVRLAQRKGLDSGILHAKLAGLSQAAGLPRAPALSEVAGLGSPIAIGLRRPEIVVPTRAERDLSPTQQSAMLAHELAHHVRHDALWQVVTRWMCGVLFFQPLNHLAARRLGQTAELLADAWAVEHTGCSRSLAECLTVVAGWMVRTTRPLPAPAMAAHGSMLERRVERLLEHDVSPTRSRGPRALRLLALAPLVAVVLAAPAVAIGAASAPTQHAEPASASGPTTLDGEIKRLEAELAELLGLLRQLHNPPPALVAGATRLETRLQTLTSQRAALARAPTPEMPR